MNKLIAKQIIKELVTNDVHKGESLKYYLNRSLQYYTTMTIIDNEIHIEDGFVTICIRQGHIHAYNCINGFIVTINKFHNIVDTQHTFEVFD